MRIVPEYDLSPCKFIIFACYASKCKVVWVLCQFTGQVARFFWQCSLEVCQSLTLPLIQVCVHEVQQHISAPAVCNGLMYKKYSFFWVFGIFVN